MVELSDVKPASGDFFEAIATSRIWLWAPDWSQSLSVRGRLELSGRDTRADNGPQEAVSGLFKFLTFGSSPGGLFD